MKRRVFVRCAVLFWAVAALILSPNVLLAQATEGSILGTVLDATGATVANARVTVTSVQTGAVRALTTSSTGEYVVTNLPLGSYRVMVEAPGFKRAVHPPVEITVKARLRVDFTLAIGDIAQSIEVSTAAPLLKTDAPDVGGVIAREQLQDLPNIGRNFLATALLVPGTSRGAPADRRRDFNGEAVTVAGASSEANNFVIEGISNNFEFSGAMGVIPAMDAIEEFAVQTSQYAAEFGRAGGAIVNIAIKSGTNQIHGFAYDYLRNDKLDARPFDFTGLNPAIQPVRRNQFGAGGGGPLRKDRWFLFGNYEGLRYPNNSLNNVAVPTTTEKRGDFTQSGYTVYDFATTRPNPANPQQGIRDPFPGNVIPSSRFEPITKRLLEFYPTPNYRDPNPSVLNNYLVTQQNADRLNSYNGKSDTQLSSTDLLTVRHSRQSGGRDRSSWMPESRIGATAILNASNTGLAYTRVVRPALINEFRFGYNYSWYGNDLLNHENILSEFNIPGIASNTGANGFPQVNLRNLTTTLAVRPIASVPTPFNVREHTFQWLDNISWHRGNHALKFGAEVTRLRDARRQGMPGNAQMGFGGDYTTATVGGVVETQKTGVAEMLLGLAGGYQTQFVFDAIRLRSTRFSAYAQDDWRVTRQLTLSYGLRYDIFQPYHELRDRMVNFDFARGQRILPESTRKELEAVLSIPGGNLPAVYRYTSPQEVVPGTNLGNFAPRFGFAYALRKGMVVRGGYGIFYGVTVSNNSSNAGTDAPFFLSLTAGTSDILNPLIVRSGFPSGRAYDVLGANSLSIYFQPLDRRDPYAQKYSFNIQMNPTSYLVVEAGYTGQHALGFPLLERLNFPTPGPGTVQTRRPYPSLGAGMSYLPDNNSNYNALELSLRLRGFRGLMLQSAFTFAKSLGYTTGTDGGLTNDPYNRRYDYGLLAYDAAARWVSGYVYRMPAPQGLPAALHYALSNWETSGILSLQSGLPFTVTGSGTSLNNGLDNNNRPNLLQSPTLPRGQRTLDRWFDTTAFAIPTLYTWGNAGKSILRAPGIWTLDFGLQKSFPVSEGKRLTIRMEAQNFTNNVNPGFPGSTFRTAAFGVIRSTQTGPRNIQLAGRFDF